MPHDNHNSANDESSDLPDEMTLRVKALETILTKKGLIDPKTLDEIIDYYSNKVGPKNGAYVVAKSWTDNKFRTQILKDPDKVLKASTGLKGAMKGLDMSEIPEGERLQERGW